jgi:hypothetical protein
VRPLSSLFLLVALLLLLAFYLDNGARHECYVSVFLSGWVCLGGRESGSERESESVAFFFLNAVSKSQLPKKKKVDIFHFFHILSSSSMLARRAGSYLSLRIMGASSSSAASDGANKATAAGREAAKEEAATSSTTDDKDNSNKPSASTSTPALTSTSTKQPHFRPLTPPKEPGPEDCCQSGCAECVWEVYYRERREYERAVAETSEKGGETASAAASPPPPLDAFAALEAKIAAQEAARKKQKETETEQEQQSVAKS